MMGVSNLRRAAQVSTQPHLRRGWTFIETSVTITLLAVITLLAAQILSLMLRFDTRTANGVATSLVRERFADRFRNDVHTAIAFELVPTVHSPEVFAHLVLTMPHGEPVNYRCEAAGISRTVAGVSAMRPSERDFYRVGEPAARFEEAARQVQVHLPGNYPTTITAVLARGER